MHIKLVITEIYPIYSEHVIFEQEPQKGTQGRTGKFNSCFVFVFSSDIQLWTLHGYANWSESCHTLNILKHTLSRNKELFIYCWSWRPLWAKNGFEHHRLLSQESTVYLALSCCLQDACLLGDVYLWLCKIYNWNRSTVEQSSVCFIALLYHQTQELLLSSDTKISNSILSTPS